MPHLAHILSAQSRQFEVIISQDAQRRKSELTFPLDQCSSYIDADHLLVFSSIQLRTCSTSTPATPVESLLNRCPPQQLWPSSGNNQQQQHQQQGRDTSSPFMSPSSSYASLGGPADQATPRASQQANPFDSITPGTNLARSTANLSLDAGKRASSPSLGPMPSGLRTPTAHGFMPLPLGTPGAGQPTTGVTVDGSMGGSSGIGFGLHEPPKMRKAMTKADGAKTPLAGSPERGDGAPLETSATPGFMESAPSSNRQADSQQAPAHNSNTPPRGTLSVKLISARGLAVSHSADAQPQPYVVIQFEQNEFISSRPHPAASSASVPFTTAQAQPMTPGNLTRSTSGLGVSTITRAFAEAVGRGKGKKDDGGLQTPKGEDGPGGGGSWLGKPGPGDPVWKEEVSL